MTVGWKGLPIRAGKEKQGGFSDRSLVKKSSVICHQSLVLISGEVDRPHLISIADLPKNPGCSAKSLVKGDRKPHKNQVSLVSCAYFLKLLVCVRIFWY